MNPGIFVPIVMFISVAVVFYAFIQARHRERMSMIEKGYDANLLQPAPRANSGKYGALKFGIVAMCIGFGFLVASILESTTTLDDEVAYFSMISLFGGLGLIIYYFLVRNKEA